MPDGDGMVVTCQTSSDGSHFRPSSGNSPMTPRVNTSSSGSPLHPAQSAAQASQRSQESALSDCFSHPLSSSGGRGVSTGGRSTVLSGVTGSPASSTGRGRGGRQQQDWQHLFQMRSELAVLKELKLGVLLGRGSYGRVYRARWKATAVAVKIVEHSSRSGGSRGSSRGGRRSGRGTGTGTGTGTGGSSGDKRFSAEKEGLLMTSMSHPNVVSGGSLG